MYRIFKRNYGGSWNNPRRLQNPDVVKNMPTFEFVSESKLKKSKLVYVCGMGALGALGIQRFYNPAITNPDNVKSKSVMSLNFRRLPSISPRDEVHDLACGQGFTLIAAEAQGTSHTVFGFGLNTHSQIGYHELRPGAPLECVYSPSPIVVPTNHTIKKVSCGRSHSLLLDEAGNVFSLGDNSFGQCGRPIKENEQYFASKKIHHIADLPSNVKEVLCGQDHSLFLTEDGKVFSCGWGADGQTGLGHYENQWKPTQVKGDIHRKKIVKISTCTDSVLALGEDNELYGWGNGEYSLFQRLVDSDDKQFNTPRHLKLLRHNRYTGIIADIAAGGTAFMILNTDGQVYIWGFGILGLGPRTTQTTTPKELSARALGKGPLNQDSKILKIYAGLSHFAAICNQGNLYTWGKNRGGALGFLHGNDQYFPLKVNLNLASPKKLSFGVDHSCCIAEKVC